MLIFCPTDTIHEFTITLTFLFHHSLLFPSFFPSFFLSLILSLLYSQALAARLFFPTSKPFILISVENTMPQ